MKHEESAAVETINEPEGHGSEQSAFLGAVHRLLRNAHGATKADLLLTAVTHALFNRHMTEVELGERVARIWPGVVAGRDEISSALRMGRELGLLTANVGLTGEELWDLTQAGAGDIQRHRDWSVEVRERAARELTLRAKESLSLDLTAGQASLWLDALVGGLIAGIQRSQDAYLGQIESMVGGQVRPRRIDRAAVLSSLREAGGGVEGERSSFLEAMALAAIDPLDEFGNELVSHITTGCILHSYVVGRDREAVLSQIGSAHGERAFLDTPCLLRLVGSTRLRGPMEVAIRAAVDAGWEVQVLEHSLDELNDVLQRALPGIADTFRRAVASGAKEEWFASLVDEQIPSIYVEAAREGLVKSPAQFLQGAAELPQRLALMGVVLRPAGNSQELSRVAAFATALKSELGDGKRRSELTVERDAETMTSTYRRRRRQKESKWPGCWVITNDRHLSPAYAAETHDKVAIALTPSQWSTLLAISADPPGVLHLAEAAAGQWLEEAMWAIPARFPTEMAIALATELSPSHGGSSMSLRVAQLTLDDALDGGERTTSTTLASRVLAQRNTMLKAVMDRQRASANKVAADAEAGRAQALLDAGAAQAAQAQAEAESSRLRSDLNNLKADQGTKDAELAWRAKQLRRAVVSVTFVMVAVGIAIAGLVLPSRLVLVAGAGSAALGGYFGYRWCTQRESSLLGIVAAGVVGLVGFASAALDLWDRVVGKG